MSNRRPGRDMLQDVVLRLANHRSAIDAAPGLRRAGLCSLAGSSCRHSLLGLKLSGNGRQRLRPFHIAGKMASYILRLGNGPVHKTLKHFHNIEYRDALDEDAPRYRAGSSRRKLAASSAGLR
jgi:hypothetical protein